jgi:uncharacterized protein with GYD domain
MATYVLLAKFTDQGIKNVKETIKRAEAFKEMASAAGVTVKDICWTLGRYDIVAMVDAKDEMSVTALGLSIGRAGNVHTETLRAFSSAEMSQILSKVS